MTAQTTTDAADTKQPKKSNRLRRVERVRHAELTQPLDADGKGGRYTHWEGWLMSDGSLHAAEDPYLFERIPGDFGDTFLVTKRDYQPGEEDHEYRVCLADGGSFCECKGFLYRRDCRHLQDLISFRNDELI